MSRHTAALMGALLAVAGPDNLPTALLPKDEPFPETVPYPEDRRHDAARLAKATAKRQRKYLAALQSGRAVQEIA